MCFSFVKNMYVNIFEKKNDDIYYSYRPRIIDMENNVLYYSVQISYSSMMFDLL